MEEESIIKLYTLIVDELGYAAENLVVGSGGGLLQVGLNRDTIAAAIKPSYISRAGQRVNVQKNPKTQASKASKTGILKLFLGIDENGKNVYHTVSDVNTEDWGQIKNELVPVFENGKFLKEYNFEELIANAEKSFV